MWKRISRSSLNGTTGRQDWRKSLLKKKKRKKRNRKTIWKLKIKSKSVDKTVRWMPQEAKKEKKDASVSIYSFKLLHIKIWKIQNKEKGKAKYKQIRQMV